MNMLRLLLFLALLLPASLEAQQFVPGKLVTLAGDTMTGMVAKATGGNFAFKVSQYSEKNFFKEDALGGYTLGNDVYERHLVDVLMGRFPERRDVFCRVVVDGPVKLLEYTGEGVIIGTFTNYFLEHADAEMPYRVSSNPKGFKSQMAIYFAEDEELAAKIKAKEVGYENISDIVLEYNSWAIRKTLEEMSEESSTDGSED